VPLFDSPADAAPNRACRRCGTELAPMALACPSCSALVHSTRLRELADLAAAAASGGDRAAARRHWHDALALLPPASDQHRQIGERIEQLREELPLPISGASPGKSAGSGWKQTIGGVVTLGALLASKLKFLLLGLTKASTFFSMFGFLAVYWGLYGWPLALGLVVSIYIHEMGHVNMLRQLGIAAGAPLFIPGVGAMVMLKEHVTDPVADARIGLAGPVWGMSAALGAWAISFATGADVWKAIGELTAFLNLFNLIPVWQLDGARGFHALSRLDRWVVVSVIGVMLFITGVSILWIVGAVAFWRALKGEPGPGHKTTVMTYCGLVIVLSFLARNVH
jgi:Zn-dependent protease